MNEGPNSEEERLRRWRLILGGGVNCQLAGRDGRKDHVLSELYGSRMKRQIARAKMSQKRSGKGGKRYGGMEPSMPDVSRWLGDIREYFPETVVQVMQQDAIEIIGLKRLLMQKEVLEQIQPDVGLIATLLTLKEVIPGETKESARLLVQKVVEDLMRRLEPRMREALRGALNRARRTRRPRHHDIDWNRTIRINLKHYQRDYRTIIPETLIGFGRKRRESPHHIVICIDQSGSMAESMVYASIFGAVMASIPALKISLVVFDTSVVDMTPYLNDPVDLLFGTTLGGGTDINQALGYCQSLIDRPEDTTLVLISDLIEGGNRDSLFQRTAHIIQSGVKLVCLLALSDRGEPAFDHDVAKAISNQGSVAFACTPDLFPELMAVTMNLKDLHQWAVQHEVKLR
jgi:Mg-chelatase subunit ChlD